MRVQPGRCEICGDAASGKMRVELFYYREAAAMEGKYNHGAIHARCAQHPFDGENVHVYIDYDYVVLEEGEVLHSA